jgi:hypothetical protein
VSVRKLGSACKPAQPRGVTVILAPHSSGRSPSRTGSRGEARRKWTSLNLNRTNRPLRYAAGGSARAGLRGRRGYARQLTRECLRSRARAGISLTTVREPDFRGCPSGAALPVATRAS